MIQGFGDKRTEELFEGNRVKRLPHDIQPIARRKLAMLNNATSLDDLLVPPANRLEKLSGSRQAQYSIRINDQWRICFRWSEGDAYDVVITDYH